MMEHDLGIILVYFVTKHVFRTKHVYALSPSLNISEQGELIIYVFTRILSFYFSMLLLINPIQNRGYKG